MDNDLVPVSFKLTPEVARYLKRMARLAKYRTMTNVISTLIVTAYTAEFPRNGRNNHENRTPTPEDAQAGH